MTNNWLNKCGICNREQIQSENEWVCRIENVIGDDKEFTVPIYNINIMTHIQGVSICEDCMESYSKIYALEHGVNFSRAGVNYYADGRNLKSNED